MAKLPPPQNRTAAAIYAWYEARERLPENDWRRPHLGASQIGDENCLRHLWYSFHWAQAPGFEGRILRLFETGQREEERVIANLRAIGMRVEAVDPSTGEQWRVTFAGGHIGGGSDGAVLGVIEAPKTWHLLEVKTSNERRFKELCKLGVREAQPGHYAQMQIYMLGLGLTRALYICVHKDTDTIYTERVPFDREYAEALIRKAATVVDAPQPLSRISEDPAWHECKFCSHRPICHERQVGMIERNCRTCTSSATLPDGTWWCTHHDKILGLDEQRAGCDAHVFVPGLLPWDIVDADDDDRSVTYQTETGSRVTDQAKELRFHG